MDRTYFSPEQDGFYGAYYPCPAGSRSTIIAMLGDAVDDLLAVAGVRWLHGLHCNVLAMSPAPKDYSHHNLPLERFGAAIAWLKSHGSTRIGITGASTTGMLALLAASYYPDITLTIAMSPSDFVMEGFYQDDLDGMHERPGDGESTVSWQGQPLPYLPFAYRHPQYWQELKREAKAGKNMVASREMFDRSEELHPVQEEEKIPVERIQGTLLLVGAEDDCLWDTCRYIRRMEQRLTQMPHACTCRCLTYTHGTHFVFPQSMLTRVLPVFSGLLVKLCFQAARQYPRECRETRIQIDQQLKAAILRWQRT